MLRHSLSDATPCIFLRNAMRYALAEMVHRRVSRHLPDIVADKQHSKASVLHGSVQSQWRLARAAVNDRSKVRRNDNAVLTVSSSMLAANELFSYGHRIVFFYREITVIFLKHRQN